MKTKELDSLVPPPGAQADWTIDQGWDRYTPAEHDVWVRLYERQAALLPQRACDPFLKGLDALDLHRAGIPDFNRINEELTRLTGWSVVAVPGLVPDEVFFDHLANRRFPAGQFIRRPDQLDYLEEPDVFHDVFGHVPMLTDPTFADYMQKYGEGGLRALGLGQLHHLARLYWYTVEFGLLETPKGLRIYGAGIVSSHAESIFALDDPSPNRLGFDLERTMRTPYRIDDFQQVYFVIPSLKALLDATLADFGALYTSLASQRDIPIEAVLSSDKVFTRGTQAYALRTA
ncbi:phenylalanine 4-monooxygenase [Phenylobacterium sp.]|uniref:phenylalanine 4-monooxygenase n=1 Tax=Phenylobacterium sp. TaxID=1871053 RepID=UPI0025DA64EB|nr:phenylalanine 4-monooxygenase [Phenylobacterium sp.]MBX3482313.1 phenylalanine 4-monooxygenase [Phenylobacterium sp.]MCW5758655.1 phenylalanine 4-monooxygenase [Phenylobacterium sp.]